MDAPLACEVIQRYSLRGCLHPVGEFDFINSSRCNNTSPEFVLLGAPTATRRSQLLLATSFLVMQASDNQQDNAQETSHAAQAVMPAAW
jgi:hypothetical protein